MSQIEDIWYNNLYDFTKSVYIFSHMKTNLINPMVQKGEKFALNALIYSTYLIYLIVIIKIIIIIGYFILFQAFYAIGRYIIMQIYAKFNNCLETNFKLVITFILRVLKRIYTFNFYIFHNKFISFLMIFCFIINVGGNFYFNWENNKQIEKEEKDITFLNFYFISFEFNLLIELLCYIFFSNIDIVLGVLLSFGYFIIFNLIIYFGYLIAARYEYLYGAFLLEEPQRILNIIIFSILMILKINCVIKILKYNKKSKHNLNLIFLFFFI